MNSVDDLQLQIFQRMREATAHGMLTWSQNESDADRFYTLDLKGRKWQSQQG
ncbi:MAG: hypothetical protein KDA60_18140 [Planctomycetales bacterium]|nr:hypothetical protein [Planctomycetales bacterium]